MALAAQQTRVDCCVEALCEQGCRAVTGFVKELESGRDLPETVNLTPAEREQVLSELSAVMAVYEGPCPAA